MDKDSTVSQNCLQVPSVREARLESVSDSECQPLSAGLADSGGGDGYRFTEKMAPSPEWSLS